MPQEVLPPGQKRMNVVMTTWAHRELKIAAAEDLTTMKNVLLAAIHNFAKLDEDDRKALYRECAALNNKELASFDR